MNLIEQLGGYEKAKECLNTKTARPCVIRELEVALLEYRRQHNIFEVGDKVVCGALMDVSNDIFIIVEIKGQQLIFNNGWNIQSDLMRHATDEEIAAGRRL